MTLVQNKSKIFLDLATISGRVLKFYSTVDMLNKALR